jgi:pimeloyl-ACP methyl ester carboxylesterase
MARSSVFATLIAAPFVAAAGWIAYSALAVDHNRALPPAVPGERIEIEAPGGRVNLYAGGTKDGAPLLLIHSVNAAGSSYEMRPLYLHYAATRPVYALDLPGFGFSERTKRTYTPRVMTDAILAASAQIRARHPGQKIDLLALSLAGEYAARAALERPDEFRSLRLLSPVGFDKRLAGDGPDQSTMGKPGVLAGVSQPLWSRAVYDLLVTPPSMRYFLQKTFGSKEIDEALFDYDQLTTHRPGAEHVVWSFLAGFLFAGDATRLYQSLTLPVWVGHGVRGDFVDYSRIGEVAGKPNWKVDVFETGAMPHFERLDEVVRAYDGFQAAL